MWSLLQLLAEGGMCYLVDGAVPFDDTMSSMSSFELSLVAHSYKPSCIKNYQCQVRDVFPSTLFMDPWTPTEILKVAAKLHPQLSNSQVSWLHRVTVHAQLCQVALLSPCTCRALLQAQRFVTTKCCIQVKERLHLVGGEPWQVCAASGFDPADDVEKTLINLKWDDMTSGFTADRVGSPKTASHRLLMISAPNWKSGEHSSLVVNRTAVM